MFMNSTLQLNANVYIWTLFTNFFYVTLYHVVISISSLRFVLLRYQGTVFFLSAYLINGNNSLKLIGSLSGNLKSDKLSRNR